MVAPATSMRVLNGNVNSPINPETGKTIWQYDPQTWKVGRPGNLGYTHRGVAYWTDGKVERIISGTHDAYLVSLDAKTGKPDPAFGVNGRVDAVIDVPRRSTINRAR